MKRIIIILFTFIFIVGIAYSESPATPTDLEEVKEYEEIDDDDCGCITAQLDRQVFLQILNEKSYYCVGDKVTLVAILINFLPEDKCTFVWEYTTDHITWHVVPNADEQTYTFILNEETTNYYWRVTVYIEDPEPINIAKLHTLHDYVTPLGFSLFVRQAGECFD